MTELKFKSFDPNTPIPPRWGGCRYWGAWRLDDDHLCNGDDYCFDLSDVTSSAEMLDMIMQISGKPWADDACLAGLVRALDDIFDPQALLCSCGKHKRITASKVRARLKRAKNCIAANGEGGERDPEPPEVTA